MSEKYHMVNWVDGMKIRKQHFIDQQNAFNQQVMHGISTQLSAMNYGLLPPSPQDGRPSCKLNIEVENADMIHLKIFSCKAATPGGFIIDIGSESGQPRHYTKVIPANIRETEKEQRYLLVLSADPFNPEERGEPDPEEIPPRRPYIQPVYQLGLLPKKPAGAAINGYGSFSISIGEVIVDSTHLQLNNQYIPPCMAVYSSPLLIDVHTQFYHSLRKLETLCIQIIRKILNKEQEYRLAVIVYQLSKDMLAYLGTMLYRFNGPLRFAPPVYLIESIASLGRLIENSMDIHRGIGKEELINYLVEWCDLNQGQFENVISQVVDHVYEHTAISEAVNSCSRFLEEITGLYTKLDELDYIGRKSGKNIFVKEEKRTSTRKKKRINFLAQ